MRKASIVQVVVIAVILGLITTAVAFYVDWLPETASKQRERIDVVFWFVTAISICIFAVVAAVIVYSVLKFRRRPDDDSDGPPIHGHTGLEIVWTAVPTVLVVAIGILSAIVLARNDKSGPDPLRVDVTSQQFAWSFKYPGQNQLITADLRLPLGRPAKLSFRALDVLHSFYVPQFGQKQDNVPGLVTTLVITPTKVGTFPVECTELCGLGHALMRSRAIVMQPKAFDAWLRKAKQDLQGGEGGDAGKAVFASNGCGSCHTYGPAGSKGKVGPSLDKLPQEAKQAGKELEAFTRESIVNPDAYIQPGYPNAMPKTYSQLPKAQLDALVTFLTSKKGS